jgi:putative glutamine amidotransferase
MAYKPRIGLTMRLELETQRFYLGRDYSEAIHAAGGTPVHISLIPDRDYISSVMEGLDGILLPGCDSDVDPSYYGEEPHPKLGRVVPEKDSTDLLVLEEAEKRNLTVLAICFGIQVLNVSRGGSLVQDIASQVENCIKHEQGKPAARASHNIRLENDGLLFRIAEGVLDAEGVKVNSHHHQAVKAIGGNLKAVAWSADGVVEGIEDVRPDRFVLGVQWHPELSWNTDEFSKAIFRSFVSNCLKARSGRVAT